MSRTEGHKKSQQVSFKYSRKLKPYLSEKKTGTPKFEVEPSSGNPHANSAGFKNGISKMGKLITKNANRSLKKSARQEWKKELLKTIEMKTNNIGLTEGEVGQLLYDENVYDENDNLRFEIVQNEQTDYDSEHGSVDCEIVIKEEATGKFYKATLTKSEWYRQSQANHEVKWKEVKPKKKTITIYV